jgi:hypothetical protein
MSTSSGARAADNIFLSYPPDVSATAIVLAHGEPGFVGGAYQVPGEPIYFSGVSARGAGGSGGRGEGGGGGARFGLLGVAVGAVSDLVHGAVNVVRGPSAPKELGDLTPTEGLELDHIVQEALDHAARVLQFPSFSREDADPHLKVQPAVVIRLDRSNGQSVLEVKLRVTLVAQGESSWAGIVSGRADGMRTLHGADGWLVDPVGFAIAVKSAAQRAALGVVALNLHQLAIPYDTTVCADFDSLPHRDDQPRQSVCQSGDHELVVLSKSDEIAFLGR